MCADFICNATRPSAVCAARELALPCEVYPSRCAVLLLSFFTFFYGIAPGPADAAPPTRCEAVTADSTTNQQSLRASQADLPASAKALARPSVAFGESGNVAQSASARALDEMLLGNHASALRWNRVPELVVLMPVMNYERGRGTAYRATSEQLTDAEAAALEADLTAALALLTDNAISGFSTVRRETAANGDVVNVMRPGQIVVGRYKGVRDQLTTIGFGGRLTRGDIIRGGSIILDSEFDRVSENRRLLRMHELGHALGYNHVQAQVSIMNPRIGPEPTDLDRVGARLAFQNFATSSQSCG